MEDSGTAKSLSKERFDRFANRYVSSPTHASGEELALLVEMARPGPTWRVLDIATGGGHTALKFAPYVDHVVATDLTPRMLAVARRHLQGQGQQNLDYSLADAESLPFISASFDLVTCRIAPHHFSDVAAFVAESCRVLVPGGKLLVQDHLLPEDQEAARYIDRFERLRDPSHNRAYSLSEWTGIFHAARLQLKRTEVITKKHYLIPWAERQGCSIEDITQLTALLETASLEVQDALEPADLRTPEATFVNRHGIFFCERIGPSWVSTKRN